MIINDLNVSFFTSTFNRPVELYRCFKSFDQLSEHYESFEWIIVDDGSIKKIDDVLDKIQKEAKFKIQIIRKKNEGKSAAINDGLLMAKGRWFCIVDDDDFVDEYILKKFENHLALLGDEQVGLAYRKKTLDGVLIGKNLKNENKILKLTPNLAGELVQGDLAYFFKTSVLSKFPFPLIAGESFVPELYIWNKVSDHGLIYYNVHDAVCYCEYLSDGLSANFKKNLKRNPKGFLIYYFDQTKRAHSIKFFIKNFIRSIQCIIYHFLRKRA